MNARDRKLCEYDKLLAEQKIAASREPSCPLDLVFTGSREPGTFKQTASLTAWIEARSPRIRAFNQGCAVGWDHEATMIAREMTKGIVYGFPCNIERFVSKLACQLSDVLHDPAEPLLRNRKMVAQGDVLLACPRHDVEPEDPREGGGTWATVRYARNLRKTVVIFWPDGRISTEVYSVPRVSRPDLPRVRQPSLFDELFA